MSKQRLSDTQMEMMLGIFRGDHGFAFSYPTERSLLRRGLIETDGRLAFRLTSAGIDVLAKLEAPNA